MRIMNRMNIRKLAAMAAMTSFSGLLLMQVEQSFADTLVVNNVVSCNNISTVSWVNDQLTVSCTTNVQPVTNPIPQPVANPTPVPVIIPTLTPVANAECSQPEPDLRIETFAGRGVDKEFTLTNGTVLVIPFASGSAGEVKKIALAQPGGGDHFKKTVIISKCPGTYNPDEYDYRTSVDVCAVTGLDMSFSVIASQSRADYPISNYRCVLDPNQRYYINVFQYDAGNRPPYVANTTNTCRTNRCGVRVSIR